jgi:hypothetical protein
MTRKALWLLAASLAALVASQWKDIARYLKILQMSSGPGPGAPQPAAPPPAAPQPAARRHAASRPAASGLAAQRPAQ